MIAHGTVCSYVRLFPRAHTGYQAQVEEEKKKRRLEERKLKLSQLLHDEQLDYEVMETHFDCVLVELTGCVLNYFSSNYACT